MMIAKSNDKSGSKDSEKKPVGAALEARKKVAGPLANTAATEKVPFDPNSLCSVLVNSIHLEVEFHA